MSRKGARAERRFHEAEEAVFADQGLEPQRRRLELAQPRATLGALELGSGEPVLLMHGASLGSVHWAPVIARLPKVRSIALDMPGHGESEGADYGGIDLRRWHTQMLSGCLDALGLESAHMVGHSYGALFAFWLALDSPDRVSSITAVGAPSVAFGARPDLTLRSLAVPGLGPLILRFPMPIPLYRRILATSLGRPAMAAASRELLRATYLGTRRRDHARTVSTYLRNQFQGVKAEPQRYELQDDELERVRQPVLVLWGDRDVRFQSIAGAKQRAARLPRCTFQVVAGGHEPWLESPDECAQLISEFVAIGSSSRRASKRRSPTERART
jgi:4,5:9,10-diseco-3-hydroxy-5,9,17-trioxoandrosta-1(10),2-diene-4-oate hydrolase